MPEINVNILVIKIGSNIITDEGGLSQSRINALASDISALHSTGYATVVVSSGAVAAGRSKLGIRGRIQDINLKQAAAAVGQSSLVLAYERAFGAHGKKVAQVLLTRDVFSDRKRYINGKNTLVTLLSLDVIPIINENDTVSIDELKFGDNDSLAALVASMLDAGRLIILSDVDGLYTDDPRKNAQAVLIPTVTEITPELEALAKGAGSISGTGGMYSKLTAAKMATRCGIVVNIVNGRRSDLLSSVLNGRVAGTEFTPTVKRYAARKGWIATGIRAAGTLFLDAGAVKALTCAGKSLLPSGITSLEGEFERGDALYCVNPEGGRIAKGLVNYSHKELQTIIGLKTDQIQTVLGYKYSDEVIHRDNMIIL
ncbi:MAG: glutamate 5-kinase [Nitrospirae bacterium]|nr:glutamate 5-kinase [Nitrospirota bacterium]